MGYTRKSAVTAGILLLLGGIAVLGETPDSQTKPGDQPEVIPLPGPETVPDVSLGEALRTRRSVRSYRAEPLSLEELGRILWAAQGITQSGTGYRTAPSAGATFPLELYAVIGADTIYRGDTASADTSNADTRAVEPIEPGIYRYLPRRHALEPTVTGDKRRALFEAALGQTAVRDAPVVIAITGVTARTAQRYGTRAERYIAMEAGHASQNIYLQAAALGLGTVAIGAFEDAMLSQVLRLPSGEEPLYLMPVGRR